MKTEMSENWKPVVGWEDFYEVSDMGRVRSLDRVAVNSRNRHGRILSPKPRKSGYVYVHFRNPNESQHIPVHRLVAKAFIPNPLNLPQVNHKTPGKAARSDNRASKLEWVTSARNVQHGFEHGRIGPKGSKNGQSILNTKQIIEIRQQYAEGTSQPTLAAVFNVSNRTISKIVLGQRWKHAGVSA
jgi:hypothetical protein